MMMMISWKSCYLTLLHLPPAELLSVKTHSMRCWLLGRRRSRPWRGCRGLNLETSLTGFGPEAPAAAAAVPVGPATEESAFKAPLCHLQHRHVVYRFDLLLKASSPIKRWNNWLTDFLLNTALLRCCADAAPSRSDSHSSENLLVKCVWFTSEQLHTDPLFGLMRHNELQLMNESHHTLWFT